MPVIPAITININGDASGLAAELAQIQANLGDIGSDISASASAGAGGFAVLAGAIAGVIAVVGSLKVAWGQLVSSIGAAAEFETLSVQFETLLGSTQAAQARMEDLANFAASTPFELPGIAKASKTLETLTKGALSTGQGLTLVGDVAAATGEDFQGIAVHVGRLYDGLQSGRPVGEAMARLQELGIISGETRAEIEALQKSGAAGDEVWSIAEASLGKFSGSMVKLSATWSGLISTLKDNFGALQRAFATPIIDALKPVLQGSLSLVQQLTPLAEAAGQKLASAIVLVRDAVTVMFNAFKSGDLGVLAFTSLKIGFSQAVNYLGGALLTALDVTVALFVNSVKRVANPDFWVGMFQVFVGIAGTLHGAAVRFIAGMVEGLDKWLVPLQAGIDIVNNRIRVGFEVAGRTLLDFVLRALVKATELADKIKPGDQSAATGLANSAKDLNSEALDDALVNGPKTWAEAMEDARASQERAVAGARAYADAVLEGSSDIAKSGFEKLAPIAKEEVNNIIDAFREFSPANIFETDGDLAKIRELITKNMGQAVEEGIDKGSDAGNKEAEKKAKSSLGGLNSAGLAVDSLSAVGGGGNVSIGGGNIVDLQKEQISWLERIAEAVGENSNELVFTTTT